jgi:hypothetical protein
MLPCVRHSSVTPRPPPARRCPHLLLLLPNCLNRGPLPFTTIASNIENRRSGHFRTYLPPFSILAIASLTAFRTFSDGSSFIAFRTGKAASASGPKAANAFAANIRIS